jgi:LCP family protein required for cell wall assembly
VDVTSAAPYTKAAVLGSKILAALLSLTIVIASYWVWNTWTGLTSSITIGPHIATTPVVAGSSSSPAKDIDGPDQNILILGNDSRDGATKAELAQLGTQADGGSANTDTMMILHVPGNGKSATIISFPRDSYVNIPGHGMAKLNAAFPDGYVAVKNRGGSEYDAQSAGINLLVQTLEPLTNLSIDHYAEVSLLGFLRISNAIGGVPVVLCTAQKEADSGINLPAGRTVISGGQAMAFVRQRHDVPGSDFGRIKRQQYFLKSAFHTLLGSGSLLFKVRDVLKAVGKSLTTDMDSSQLLNLASTFSDLADGNVVTQTIPYDGTADRPVGGSTQNVVLVTPARVQAFVTALIAGTPASGSTTAPTAGASGPTGSATGSTGSTGGTGSTGNTAANVPIGTGVPNVANQPGCVA